MTVQNEDRREDYDGNDVTVLFAVTFYFLKDSHLAVTSYSSVTELTTILVLDADYTVTGAGESAGGSITTTTAPEATDVLTILRDVPTTQLIEYSEHDSFPAKSHESALDQLTMLIQQLENEEDRSFRLPPSIDPNDIGTELAPEKSKYIGWDAAGTSLENKVSTSMTIASIGLLLSDYDTLALAIVAAGLADKALYLDISSSDDATVPSTVVVVPMVGAIMSGTVAWNGPIIGDPKFQWLSGSNHTGLSLSRPEWFGGVIDDSGTDSAPFILKALEAVAPQEGVVLMSPGVYYVATEIVPTQDYFNMIWKGEGGCNIIWNGSTDSSKSIFRATTTTTTDFAKNVIENLDFDAATKAGFAFVIEGNAITNGNASTNTFNKCDFNRGSVTAFLMGENAEPAVNDSASSQNTFNQCTFGYSPYNLKVNSINAYETTCNSCQFNSTAGDKVTIQHVRILFGGMTRLNDSEFANMDATQLTNGTLVVGQEYRIQDFISGDDFTNVGGANIDGNVFVATGATPTTWANSSILVKERVCVYSESPVVIRNTYSEEGRALRVPSLAHSHNEFVSIYDWYTNDSRTDAGLSGSYFANITSGVFNGKGIGAKSGTSGVRPIILKAQIAYLENITLGGNGRVILTKPEKSVIDGLIPGGFESLIHPFNWNMQHWVDTAGSDDIPMYWTKYKGTGGTAVFLRSTSNNVYGDYTMHVNVSGASSNTLIGVRESIGIGPGYGSFSVVVTGKTDGTDANAPYVRLGNVNKAILRIINSDNTFIVVAEINPTNATVSTATLDIGMAANLTGEFYIDTITVVPGLHGTGLPTGLIAALNMKLPFTITTLANDATPSINTINKIYLTGGTTTITDFDKGTPGQEITLIAAHILTITDGTNILLNNNVDFKMQVDDNLSLIQQADGKWYETSRRNSRTGIKTLANDGTPTVINGKTFRTGGTTTITDFDNGVEGQEITILASHSITITDGTNMLLNGSVDFTMTDSDTLSLILRSDDKWHETGRGDNGA